MMTVKAWLPCTGLPRGSTGVHSRSQAAQTSGSSGGRRQQRGVGSRCRGGGSAGAQSATQVRFLPSLAHASAQTAVMVNCNGGSYDAVEACDMVLPIKTHQILRNRCA